MLKAEQVPDEVWTELALRLESCGAVVSDEVARLAACTVVNAWPEMFYHPARPDEEACIFLPLPQEARDE